MNNKVVLWWGRSDVDYSRNRIVRQLFVELGWKIIDFQPKVSALADVEANFKSLGNVSLVWVPCFRQRDLAAAKRWAKRRQLPLIFDPLISAYDKQVFERKKFSEQSKKAKKLLKWEQCLLQAADYLLADTQQHADFYIETMKVNAERVAVLPVGAEESLFQPRNMISDVNLPVQILFFGSYIALQGPEIIAEAIKLYEGDEVEWHFVGDGPLRETVQTSLIGIKNVHFSDWLPYEQLPEKIAQADICLGIFGTTEKTRRVIANKVYQALACARPVVSCESEAYPAQLQGNPNSGIYFVPSNNPQALADMLAQLASQPEKLKQARQAAFSSYQQYFSNALLKKQLSTILQRAALLN